MALFSKHFGLDMHGGIGVRYRECNYSNIIKPIQPIHYLEAINPYDKEGGVWGVNLSIGAKLFFQFNQN
ncbi:hypothetical protein ACFLRI_03670 [Bacteroidota bacterium]